jgi:hypothetical protein
MSHKSHPRPGIGYILVKDIEPESTGLAVMSDLRSERTPVVDGGLRPLVPRQTDGDNHARGRRWRDRVAALFLEDQPRFPEDQALPQDRALVPQDQARLPQDQALLPEDQERLPQDQELLPEDQARPGLARSWYWAVLAVAVGTLISLGRVPSGPGVLNTIWAEDGADFLTDALNRNPYAVIVRPLNGYFVVVPRLLAIPASLVPIEWGPAVLTIEAAVVTALMAVGVYVASRTYLRHPLARLIAAVPVLAVPVGENIAAGASNNVATLQFPAVYLALWMVLWVPARRGARILSAVVVLAVCLSTFLAVVLLPLALLRLYARRDATSGVMAGSLMLGLVANIVALSTHLTARPVIVPSRYDLPWALSRMVGWALPHALFGYGITGNGGQEVGARWLVWASWGIVALAVLAAALGLSRPQWKAAAVFGATAAILLIATIMQFGTVELRYAVAPELMLFAALAALLLPRPNSRLPLVILSVGVALVLAFSYRTAGPRTTEAPWRLSVAKARMACEDVDNGVAYIFPGSGEVLALPNGTPLRDQPPPGFPVLVPCSRLR